MTVKPAHTLPRTGHPRVSGMVAWWPFFDGAGDRLTDIYTNQHAGSLANMDPAADWVVGRYGGPALDFDGLDDEVVLPGSVEFIPATDAPISISGNFLARTTSSGSIFRLFRNKFGSAAVRVYLITGDRLAVLISGSSGNTSLLHDIVADTWYHFVYTYDGNEAILYVDGARQDSATGTTLTEAQSDADPATISSSGDPFDGMIEDVRFWSRALSEQEAESLYELPFEDLDQEETIFEPTTTGTDHTVNAYTAGQSLSRITPELLMDALADATGESQAEATPELEVEARAEATGESQAQTTPQLDLHPQAQATGESQTDSTPSLDIQAQADSTGQSRSSAVPQLLIEASGRAVGESISYATGSLTADVLATTYTAGESQAYATPQLDIEAQAESTGESQAEASGALDMQLFARSDAQSIAYTSTMMEMEASLFSLGASQARATAQSLTVVGQPVDLSKAPKAIQTNFSVGKSESDFSTGTATSNFST